jgi:hypothetical protein
MELEQSFCWTLFLWSSTTASISSLARVRILAGLVSCLVRWALPIRVR